MDEFQDAVAEWRALPFPPGSATNAIDELHADLALADSWIAEAVVPFLNRGVHSVPQVDVVNELRELSERVAALEHTGAVSERQLLTSYAIYIAVLQRVYMAFLSESPGKP